MSLSKKQRDAMRQALSVLDGFTFTEDEDEFMAGVGLGGICVDLGRCLDDLVEKDEEIEALKAKAERLEKRLVNAGHVSDARMLELAEKHEETGVKP